MGRLTFHGFDETLIGVPFRFARAGQFDEEHAAQTRLSPAFGFREQGRDTAPFVANQMGDQDRGPPTPKPDRRPLDIGPHRPKRPDNRQLNEKRCRRGA